MSYSIAELDSIQPGIAIKLRSFGIRTTSKLLEAARNPKGRKLLAERTGLSPQCLLRVANFADKMRIKGIGDEYAELLEVAGVDTVRAEVSQSGQSRQADGGGEQAAQARPRAAFRESRPALDRDGEEVADQDQLLTAFLDAAGKLGQERLRCRHHSQHQTSQPPVSRRVGLATDIVDAAGNPTRNPAR